MSKNLQIICNKDNWDKSQIVACGFMRNGRKAIPVRFAAETIEEPWIDVWHGMVEQLKGLDPGGWAATLIHVDKVQVPAVKEGEGDEGSGEEPTTVPSIRLIINRRWDDDTTDDPVTLTFGDEAVIGLFDHLTRDDQ